MYQINILHLRKYKKMDESKNTVERKVATIGGLNKYMAKRISQYVFGEFFMKSIQNNKTLTHEIYLKDSFIDENNAIQSIETKKALIEDFEYYWQGTKVIIMRLG